MDDTTLVAIHYGVIPVVYLFAKSGKSVLDSKETALVKRYLLVSRLRSLFRGATETAVNYYVNAVRDAQEDVHRLTRALTERIPKNRLFRIRKEDVSGTSGMYSPLMQIYLAYLYEHDAKSWPSVRPLRDILQQALVADPLGVHHIFPRKSMQDRDFPVDRLNTVANYAILSQADNAELADRDPFDVWRSLKSHQQNVRHCSFAFGPQITSCSVVPMKNLLNSGPEKSPNSSTVSSGWARSLLRFTRTKIPSSSTP